MPNTAKINRNAHFIINQIINGVIFKLFGGSGGEIIQCEQLSRKWISCELNQEYYQMILDRLENNGDIKIEYKLQNKRNKYTSLDYINQ